MSDVIKVVQAVTTLKVLNQRGPVGGKGDKGDSGAAASNTFEQLTVTENNEELTATIPEGSSHHTVDVVGGGFSGVNIFLPQAAAGMKATVRVTNMGEHLYVESCPIPNLADSGFVSVSLTSKGPEDGWYVDMIGSDGPQAQRLPVLATQVTVVGADGNWPKPAGLVLAKIEAYGGGSGGGSGRRGAANSNRAGGGGGTHGAKVIRYLTPDEIHEDGLDITIGLGGDGGAAQTVDSNNGNPGAAGGKTIITSGGNPVAVANGGNAQSVGGGTTPVTTGAPVSIGSVPGSSGVPGLASGAAPTYTNVSETGGPGGGGGGISNTNALTNGTDGMSRGNLWGDTQAFGGAGAGLAGNPDGTNGSEDAPGRPGGGGGGGSPQAADRGGNGGNGGRSAGGGGGAGSLNGYNSGAGGRGGDGFVVITALIQS